jgi:hypothetical protein
LAGLLGGPLGIGQVDAQGAGLASGLCWREVAGLQGRLHGVRHRPLLGVERLAADGQEEQAENAEEGRRKRGAQ